MDAFVESQKKKRDIALALFFASYLVSGFADMLLEDNETWSTPASVIGAIVSTITIVLWCRHDSQMRQFVISGRLWFCIWFIALLGVPAYLISSRGWRGAAKIGFGVPALLVGGALYFAAWYGTEWIAVWAGFFD